MPDIDAAMLEMGEALGVTWCSLQERDQSVRIPQNGLQTVPLSLNPPFWWGGRVRGVKASRAGPTACSPDAHDRHGSRRRRGP